MVDAISHLFGRLGGFLDGCALTLAHNDLLDDSIDDLGLGCGLLAFPLEFFDHAHDEEGQTLELVVGDFDFALSGLGLARCLRLLM